MLIRLLSRLVKDFTNLIHTYFSSSKTAPSVASETSADRPSDQFFPPRAKLLGPASSGRFARTGVSFRALVMQPSYKKMQWLRGRKQSPSNFCMLLKNSKFRRTPPPVAKARESPLVKLDSSHDTLGWVVHITNRQVSYIHGCVHT